MDGTPIYLSMHISKELKGAGFTIVGPIIIYAFIQTARLVNIHIVDFFWHEELSGSGALIFLHK